MSGVNFEIIGDAAYITIDRPHVANALEIDDRRAIIDKLRDYRKNDDLVAVVFRGSEGQFCSGGDMAELEDYDFETEGIENAIRSWAELCETIQGLGKVVIAEVEGHAIAGGFNMLLFMDIVLTAEEARFSNPEVEMGLIDPFSATRLPHLVGLRNAVDIMTTGKILTGEEAADIGLATRAVPAGDLREETEQVLERISKAHPATLARTKELMLTSYDMDPSAAVRHGKEVCINEAEHGDGYPEGFIAYLEHREPKWNQ